MKNVDTSSLEFRIAYELTIEEFCGMCHKQGLNVEQTKRAIKANAENIAQRIASIMA